MIAKLDIKSCPFRKKVLHTNMGGKGTEEFFLECVEKECMAWEDDDNSCLLMREKKNEKSWLKGD